MYLIVDVGNSRAKVVVVESDRVVYQTVAENLSADIVSNIVMQYQGICSAIISTTRGDGDSLKAMVEGYVERVLLFVPATTPIPIKNGYHTPQTLGADRLAAAVGAWAMSPDSDVMVVDFGTAITIDYVVDGEYRGGNISPGVTTRFRALADYTACLPLCQPTDEVLEYGRTTVEAIEQGVMRGVENEIRGYVEAFSKENDKKRIIFTGGDAKYFVKRIKNTIFADCEPLIYGLTTILRYNAERE
ncbi:MAG: type III pantothenate kinase [Alistipes sp.]|nr:type III pantothenate kinase [Alistipes sp.]MBO7264281.1 type III pantothenate kinase [Alistipes sp.]